MSFSFGFSGDDIEGQAADHSNVSQVEALSLKDHAKTDDGARVQRLDLDEVLASLPSHISYYTTALIGPRHGRQTLVPRRALFDIRAQLMAEDEPDAPEVAGLGESDIEQNVYEGGFKSWEGAMDLALLMLDRQGADAETVDHVVELGCGTALPLLIVLQQHIASASNLPLRLTLADYNASVLRLVTLPNLLLVWALHHHHEAFSPTPPRTSADGALQDGEGDLDVTPEMVDAFKSSLKVAKIEVSLLAGPWTPDLVTAIAAAKDKKLLVLAAETIYSPASTPAFTRTVLDILRAADSGCALIAAKRVYFGVGGGVVDFEKIAECMGAKVETLTGTGISGADPDMAEGSGGVARWIGQIALA